MVARGSHHACAEGRVLKGDFIAAPESAGIYIDLLIAAMRNRLLFVCLTLALLLSPQLAGAQFTEAHNYDNTPTGVNQVELAYAYTHANASIDASLIITGAKFNVNQGSISYTRYFGFVRRLVWAEASVPLAGLGGSVSGTMAQGSTTGTGDSSYTLAMLLKDGSALSVEQFADYKPTTTVGISLTISAPTGQYNPNKLLNLGSDRWSFKPEIALSHPFGPQQKWQLDAYANAYFFTNNTSYHGAEILRQEPLPAIEGHISYSLINSLWASLDTRYSFHGSTLVDGVNQNNSQQNFILGTELNVSLNRRNSLVFEFGKALVHQNGPALTAFAVKYSFTWGKGY